MKYNHNPIIMLKNALRKLDLSPENDLVIDGDTYTHEVVKNNKTYKISYKAVLDTFGSDYVHLIYNGGIIDSPISYSITIIQQPNGLFEAKVTINGVC